MDIKKYSLFILDQVQDELICKMFTLSGNSINNKNVIVGNYKIHCFVLKYF